MAGNDARALTDRIAGSVLSVRELTRGGRAAFELVPDAQTREAIAQELGVNGLSKLRFSGTVAPEQRADWRLNGQLGATVAQTCVSSLGPVSTRIDEPVTRLFLDELKDEPGAGSETEMVADENEELLGTEIDLVSVMLEALALAIPQYPRAQGALMSPVTVTEPGVTPLDEDSMRPFAGLAALKDTLDSED